MRRRHRSASILPLLAVAGTAMLIASCLRDRPGRPAARRLAAIHPRVAAGAAGLPAAEFVRPAGTGAMRDPPREWDDLDEQIDESFPASDPPGNY